MSATDPMNEHEALVAQLRANPPLASDRLRQRVLTLAPSRRSRRRRLAVIVVPVAVALAVGAALIHAFVSSNPRNTADAPALAPYSLGQLDTGTVPKAAARQLHRKAVTNGPVFSAAQATSGSALDQEALPGVAHGSVVIPKNRLVHADATLQVNVPNRSALSKATNKATQIVSSLGGYAQSVQYESSRQGYGSAFLALRVPVGKAQTAISRLGQLGTLASQQISTRDLQQQLTRQTNQIGTLQRAIAVYEQALQSGSLSASQRVEIQIRLANAQHELKQQRKAKSGTLASGATADISLTLATHKTAVAVGHHKSGRLGRLLGSAVGFLGLEGIIVLYALIVISPIVLIGGLAWWLVRERRRREESRLLASA